METKSDITEFSSGLGSAIVTTDMKATHKRLLSVVNHDPGNFDGWLLLGWTAASASSARAYFEKALEIRPGDALALDGLAWAEEKNPDMQNERTLPNLLEEPAMKIPLFRVIGKVIPHAKSSVPTENAALSSLRLWLFSLLYLVGIAIAEALTTFGDPAPGLLLHGLLMGGLLLHSALSKARGEQRVYLCLAMAPLIRLISLSIPLKGFPFFYWYMLVGAPLFLALFLVVRYTGFGRKEIGLTINKWALQVAVGLAGLGLGYVEYLILHPAPLASTFTLEAIWLPGTILVIFTGLLEELIFRGVMQRAFVNTLGRWRGLLYVSLVFAVLHLGYKSAPDMLFVFCVALAFGYISLRTGSILGVTLAHGLTNFSLFLIVPFLLSPPAITTSPVAVYSNGSTQLQAANSVLAFNKMQSTPLLPKNAMPANLQASFSPTDCTSQSFSPTNAPAVQPKPESPQLSVINNREPCFYLSVRHRCFI